MNIALFLVCLVTVTASAQEFPGIGILAPTTASAVRVYYVTDRKLTHSSKGIPIYTAERSDNESLRFGSCIVTIPRSHVLGTLEEPGLFELNEDVTRHVILQKIDVGDETTFYSQIRARMAKATSRDVFIFIHGYNTSFKDATRRTAQIAYDLKFQGAPILYSWPSQGSVAKYTVDETNVDWTLPHLIMFLKALRAKSGAQRVFIIAHSMGGRILTRAMQEIQQTSNAAVRFNQIVLAAPDIDRDTFIHLANAVNQAAERVTLYASSHDRALNLSKQVHGYPRAGDSGRPILALSGIDTIDASSVSTDFLGHSYFASRTILSDVFLLFKDGLGPEYRFGLFPRQQGTGVYWVMHP